MTEYRIIIAGGRDFNNTYLFEKTINQCLSQIFDYHNKSNDRNFTVEIVSGGAKGADSMGERYAAFLGYPVRKFLPNWNLYGKAAGPFRNEQMAKYANKEGNGILIAFWDGKSSGTKSMINLAKKHGLDVHIQIYNGDEKDEQIFWEM